MIYLSSTKRFEFLIVAWASLLSSERHSSFFLFFFLFRFSELSHWRATWWRVACARDPCRILSDDQASSDLDLWFDNLPQVHPVLTGIFFTQELWNFYILASDFQLKMPSTVR